MLEAILIISFVLKIVINLYIAVLWGRFILDWVRVLNPSWRPKGFVVILVETVYTITDPPLRFIRRILPPLRVGTFSLDFGWMITLVACWILLALLP